MVSSPTAQSFAFHFFRCCWGMLLILHLATSAATAAEERFNVVFILADDLGWGELGCYGQEKIPTPNIDSLAREGMRFTQHYSGAPVCAPSRCVLMTGKHSGHAEIRGNQQAKVLFPEFSEGQHPLSAAAKTLAETFQEHGYVTGAMGKWGLGPVGSTGDPNRQGFDLFFGYNCQAVAHSYYPRALWRNNQQVVINSRPIPSRAQKPEGEVRIEDYVGEEYAPRRMIAEAEAFIDVSRDRPFFLYLPFIEPHVAMHPPRDIVDPFPADWDKEVYRGENSYLPHPRPRAAYASMIADLDRHVGRILAKLKEHRLEQRTLVIFTSDNGTTHAGNGNPRFHVGGVDAKFFESTRSLRGYKGSVYEGGIRVPLVVRLPGAIAAGAVSEMPSYFADWFPTLCQALSLKAPEALDGVSLWPVLTGKTPRVARNPMLWVFPEYGGQVAIRIGDMKLVRQRLGSAKPGAWEVYDLEHDPGETTNRAADHSALLVQAKEILRNEVDENAVFPVNLALDADGDR